MVAFMLASLKDGNVMSSAIYQLTAVEQTLEICRVSRYVGSFVCLCHQAVSDNFVDVSVELRSVIEQSVNPRAHVSVRVCMGRRVLVVPPLDNLSDEGAHHL